MAAIRFNGGAIVLLKANDELTEYFLSLSDKEQFRWIEKMIIISQQGCRVINPIYIRSLRDLLYFRRDIVERIDSELKLVEYFKDRLREERDLRRSPPDHIIRTDEFKGISTFELVSTAINDKYKHTNRFKQWKNYCQLISVDNKCELLRRLKKYHKENKKKTRKLNNRQYLTTKQNKSALLEQLRYHPLHIQCLIDDVGFEEAMTERTKSATRQLPFGVGSVLKV